MFKKMTNKKLYIPSNSLDLQKNIMKKCVLLILVLFLSVVLFSQDILVFEKSSQIESNRGRRVFREINQKIETNNTLELTYSNGKDTIKVKTAFPYNNNIEYSSSSTINRMVLNQTHGEITCDVLIVMIQNEIKFLANNFTHLPKSSGDKLFFGVLNTGETAPETVSFDYSVEWTNAVWLNMKELSINFAEKLFTDIMP